VTQRVAVRIVIVTMVLLNVLCTWATPRLTLRRAFFFFPLAIAVLSDGCGLLVLDALLAGDRLAYSLAAAALVLVRWPRHGKFLRCRSPRYALISFNRAMLLASCRAKGDPRPGKSRSSSAAMRAIFVVREFLGPALWVDVQFLAHLERRGRPQPADVPQGNVVGFVRAEYRRLEYGACLNLVAACGGGLRK